METQRDSRSLGQCSLWLLLLGLVIPAATAQALSYEEAVLRAVDGLNQRSSDDNLYRLLELDPQPKGDKDPDTPKPVSLTVKETVCPRSTQQPLELCPFKENGLVKQCVGTVILDPGKEYFDISCDEPEHVRRRRGLRKVFKKVGKKIRKKIGRIGDRIGGIFIPPIVVEY